MVGAIAASTELHVFLRYIQKENVPYVFQLLLVYTLGLWLACKRWIIQTSKDPQL